MQPNESVQAAAVEPRDARDRFADLARNEWRALCRARAAEDEACQRYGADPTGGLDESEAVRDALDTFGRAFLGHLAAAFPDDADLQAAAQARRRRRVDDLAAAGVRDAEGPDPADLYGRPLREAMDAALADLAEAAEAAARDLEAAAAVARRCLAAGPPRDLVRGHTALEAAADFVMTAEGRLGETYIRDDPVNPDPLLYILNRIRALQPDDGQAEGLGRLPVRDVETWLDGLPAGATFADGLAVPDAKA